MEKGFTLIELLAVIVILAIILAIAIPGIASVISSSTLSAFESDAKMVLEAIDYKKLDDSSFNASSVNQDNINDKLGLSNNNYSSLKITIVDNISIITVVGKNRWNGLIACGSYNNIRIVDNQSDCGTDLVPPSITLNGDSIININKGDIYTDSGATATDNIDGDISGNIVITGSVNPNIAGTYFITYSVTDIAGNIATITRTVNVLGIYAGPSYIDDKGVNGPVLATGMIPIKWNGSSWIDTTVTDSDWYNYNTTDKKWANARTTDGSMWVWIPRYIYKISSGWHSNTTGTIEVQFSKGTDDNWNNLSIGNIDTGTTANASNNKWTNHPAFDFGSTKLTGIWIAKFEPTAAEGVANGYVSDNTCPTVGDDVSTKTIKILPNVTSWTCITMSNAFTAVRNMEAKSTYGWDTASGLQADGNFTTDTNNINTHLMKNTEWGVVAYLSKSNYGQNTNEIYINNNQNYITGCAGDTVAAAKYDGCQNTYESTGGVKASTTGNIYGTYDLSGGAYERLSAYVDNTNENLAGQGLSIINASGKYKDVYPKGSTDDHATNYNLAINFKGDAVYETSNTGTGSSSWFGDSSSMVYGSGPWFNRGGRVPSGSVAGAFSLNTATGTPYNGYGFRPVLVVGVGL